MKCFKTLVHVIPSCKTLTSIDVKYLFKKSNLKV